jgi:hypothetical protein
MYVFQRQIVRLLVLMQDCQLQAVLVFERKTRCACVLLA